MNSRSEEFCTNSNGFAGCCYPPRFSRIFVTYSETLRLWSGRNCTAFVESLPVAMARSVGSEKTWMAFVNGRWTSGITTISRCGGRWSPAFRRYQWLNSQNAARRFLFGTFAWLCCHCHLLKIVKIVMKFVSETLHYAIGKGRSRAICAYCTNWQIFNWPSRNGFSRTGFRPWSQSSEVLWFCGLWFVVLNVQKFRVVFPFLCTSILRNLDGSNFRSVHRCIFRSLTFPS